jgi:putative transposase
MLAVNCMPDHIHLFVGFKPSILISDFVKEIKVESNDFINQKNWIKWKIQVAGRIWRIFLFAFIY